MHSTINVYVRVKSPAPALAVQDQQNNDKILIYTPDGKCIDYFVMEPADILDQGQRTGEAPCSQGCLQK